MLTTPQAEALAAKIIQIIGKYENIRILDVFTNDCLNIKITPDNQRCFRIVYDTENNIEIYDTENNVEIYEPGVDSWRSWYRPSYIPLSSPDLFDKIDLVLKDIAATY